MSCRVSIPLTVLEDPCFLPLREAFHPETMESRLRTLLPERGSGAEGSALGAGQLESIRVFRHKPAKRCLVEYAMRDGGSRVPGAPWHLIGKIRAKGPDQRSYTLLRKLWSSGFDAKSVDGIAIPEPIGLIESSHLLLQRKVLGDSLETFLRVPQALAIAHRVAEAAVKLHRLELRPSRKHTVADECSILRDRFDRLSETRPSLRARLDAIFEACCRLFSAFEEGDSCCIHRDFYPAQVILSGPLVHLLDFDLCCCGDPALDIGNFLGHITEQSLREHGHAGAYSCFELMLKERYLELTAVELRPRIRAYQTVTVARHLYLCTLKPDRVSTLPLLLDWCEERLGLGSSGKPRVQVMPGARNHSAPSVNPTDSVPVTFKSE